MPYRRLPNTDISRIRALNKAIEKSNNTDFQDLALSTKTLSDARQVVKQFELTTQKYQQTFDTQVKSNILFQDKVKTIRLYISHFIQVLYMSVIRNEIKKEHLAYYGLEKYNLLLPTLLSNEQILEWGEKIIRGEKQRIENGGVPIYNPGIARVKVMFALFKDGFQAQKAHQKATNRIQEKVTDYRTKADQVILSIWNDVEEFNSHLPEAAKIEANKAYGIVYYYRKGEVVK